MVPQQEIIALAVLVTQALSQAEGGEVAEGYALLARGMKDTETATAGKCWAPDLMLKWHREIERYRERYFFDL